MNYTHVLAIAAMAAVASTGASAAGKSMKQRDARTEKVAQATRLLRQPVTMAEAAGTKMTLADGSEGYLVPTQLWNTLAVQADANGATRVVETDGNVAAPATAKELPRD
jgi:hypothetical protein